MCAKCVHAISATIIIDPRIDCYRRNSMYTPLARGNVMFRRWTKWKDENSFRASPTPFFFLHRFFFSLLLCSPCSTLRESFLGAENVSQLDNTSSLYHDGVTYYFRCTGCLQRRKLSSSFARRKSHQHRRVLIASLRTRSRSHRLTELDKVSAFII